jgi:hypothetical protein
LNELTLLYRTCFWAGNTFTPELKIHGPQGDKPIQEFLQDAFLAMWAQVVRAVGDLPGVLGFEVSLFIMK